MSEELIIGVAEDRVRELAAILEEKKFEKLDDYLTELKSMNTTEDERLVVCIWHGAALGRLYAKLESMLADTVPPDSPV